MTSVIDSTMLCPGCVCLTCRVSWPFRPPQHSGDWRRRLAHAGPVRLGERLLRVRPALGPVGLLHVEVPAQRRRWGSLLSECCVRSACSSCALMCRCAPAGPIITLESLGSGGSHSKLSKRHWLRLLRQPAVWWDDGSVCRGGRWCTVYLLKINIQLLYVVHFRTQSLRMPLLSYLRIMCSVTCYWSLSRGIPGEFCILANTCRPWKNLFLQYIWINDIWAPR